MTLLWAALLVDAQAGTPLADPCVPAGRSDPSAVQMAAGSTARRTISYDRAVDVEASADEHTIVVAQEAEPLAPPATATDAGIASFARYVPTGTNYLEADLGMSRVQGVGLGNTFGYGELSGPVVRDKAWAYGVFRHDQATGPRDHIRNQGAATLTLQPHLEHRTQAHVAARLDQLDGGPTELDQQVIDGHLQHTWFHSAEALVALRGQVRDVAWLGDRRMQQGLHSDAELEAGDHLLAAAVDLDRLAWVARGEGLARWLDTAPPPTGEVLRLGIGAEDVYRTEHVELWAGVRSDLTLGRAHLAPRGSIAWHPRGDARTTLRVGAARRYGHVDVSTAVLQRDDGLSRVDEGSIDLGQELVDDLTLAWTGTVRAHRDVPQPGGDRAALSSWASDLELRKWWSRRWEVRASWRHAQRTDDLTLVDDGSLPGFSHVLVGSMGWALPLDPWTTRLQGVASLHLDPLGTLVPDLASNALPNAPRWTLGAQLSQTLPLRKGALLLELEAAHVELLDDPRDLSRYVLAQQVLPEQVGFGGLRLRGGLRYTF